MPPRLDMLFELFAGLRVQHGNDSAVVGSTLANEN